MNDTLKGSAINASPNKDFIVLPKVGNRFNPAGIIMPIPVDTIGIVVPVELLQDFNISASSKLLFGIIVNIYRVEKKCNITNQELGIILNVGKRTISKLISQLEKFGYITISYSNLNDISYHKKREICPKNYGLFY